jgi:hypothetical protein
VLGVYPVFKPVKKAAFHGKQPAKLKRGSTDKTVSRNQGYWLSGGYPGLLSIQTGLRMDLWTGLALKYLSKWYLGAILQGNFAG